MRKVSIIGAGHVGEHVALFLMQREVAEEIVLVDIIPDMPIGKGLDMREASPILNSDSKVIGTNNYEDIKGSDVVVITAGVPRKPGMDRMDLLSTNMKICKSIVGEITKYAPDSIIIYVANPVDVLTYAAFKLSGFPANRVFGMAGVLDTARYRAFIAMEANVSVKDIKAMVLGGHGDSMVPLPSFTTIGGIPLKHFLPQEKIDAIIQRTRKGGGEIVSLLKTGSAYYAPGAAVAEMVEAILRDQRRILPAVAHLNGEYGESDVYVGAPVIIGKNGIEKVLEIDMTEEELAAYKNSINHVKDGIKLLYDNKLL